MAQDSRLKTQGNHKRWALLWFCLVITLHLAPCPLHPVVEAHSEEATIALRTYTPITIDGKLDDWVRRVESSNWSGKMEVKKGQVVKWMRAVPTYLNTITSRVEAGMISGPDDLSATIYFLWDPQSWYMAAIVKDDEVVAEHEGENIWQDDAVELWIDCRHDSVTHPLFQDDEYQIGFSPASQHRKSAAWVWRNPDPEPVIKAIQVASVSPADGYVLEASVPWAAMHGCQPSIGSMSGFNISIVDKDADQLWSHMAWSGQLHSDPSQFGHLYFLDAPVDIFPSDVFETPGTSDWDVMMAPGNGKERSP